MRLNISHLAVLPILAVVAAACGGPGGNATPTPADSQAALPNPASVFCESNGGRLEIRTAADGSQAGFCIFADGTECDEWAYYRGECKPGGAANAPAGPVAAPPVSSGPPVLKVLEPQPNAVFNTPQIRVAGTASPGTVVVVNDVTYLVGQNGTFEVPVDLVEGVNLITIVANNEDGEVQQQLTVVYRP